MLLSRKSGLAGAIAGVVALGLATSAMAQGGPPRHGPGGETPNLAQQSGSDRHGHSMVRQMDILDTDGNGSASKEEIAAEHGRLLGAADIDGDGQLSPDEFRRRGTFFIRLGTTTFFDLIDTNGDQKISVEELNQPMERWFARRDTNSDGTIDAEEFTQDSRTFGPHHR